MDKKEYIVNQIKKSFGNGKKYENYCVTRIIALIDNLDIQFVTQQMFKRKEKDIAYADLYFPQINLWVEVNEGYHKNNIENDKLRTKEVIQENKIDRKIKAKYDALDEVVYLEKEEPFVIQVYDNTIEDIHDQINQIVDEVNKRVKALGDKFVPWSYENNNPYYYRKMGYIEANTVSKFRTIDEACELFNVIPNYYNKMHGYIPLNETEYAWFPTLKINGCECDNNAWENEISQDGKIIYENQKEKDDKFLKEVLDKDIIRYVFVKYKDITGIGNTIYKFIGIYKINKEETIKNNIRVWDLFNKKIDLTKYI
jgi:very-short-patch-repair endonuclease